MNIEELHELLGRLVEEGEGETEVIIEIDGRTQFRALYPDIQLRQGVLILSTHPRDIGATINEVIARINGVGT